MMISVTNFHDIKRNLDVNVISDKHDNMLKEIFKEDPSFSFSLGDVHNRVEVSSIHKIIEKHYKQIRSRKLKTIIDNI